MKQPTDKQVQKEIESCEAEIKEHLEGNCGTEQDVREAVLSLEDRINGIKWARGIE